MNDKLFSYIESHFEKVTYSKYVIFLQEILLLLILLTGLLVFFLDPLPVIAAEIILSIVYFYVLLTKVSPFYKKDSKAYLTFFTIIFMFAQLVWILPTFVKPTGSIAQALNQMTLLFGGIVLFALLFFFGFRMLFKRDYVKGIVKISDKKSAVVTVDFDIYTFTRSNDYLVESNSQYPVGTKVKVQMSNSIFKNKPKKIISEF